MDALELRFAFNGGNYQVPAEVLRKPSQHSLREQTAWGAELLARKLSYLNLAMIEFAE